MGNRGESGPSRKLSKGRRQRRYLCERPRNRARKSRIATNVSMAPVRVLRGYVAATPVSARGPAVRKRWNGMWQPYLRRKLRNRL